MLYSQILHSKLSPVRKNFVVPRKWPHVATNLRNMKEAVLAMGSTPEFETVVDTLVSDSCWFPLFDLQPSDCIEIQREGAKQLAYQLLCFAYNIATGDLNKTLIVEGLSFGFYIDFTLPKGTPITYEAYKTSKYFNCLSFDQVHTLESFSLWQLLRSMLCNECLQQVIKRVPNDMLAECESWHARDFSVSNLEVFQTWSYKLDFIIHMLRMACAFTASIQRLHLQFLIQHEKELPEDKMVHEILHKTIKHKKKITKGFRWKNYISDLVFMWFHVSKLYTSFVYYNRGELLLALKDAYLWCLSTGLVASSKHLQKSIQSDLLDAISTIACSLQTIYVRLWDFMQQNYLSTLETFRESTKSLDNCLQAVGSIVFLHSETKMEPLDKPNVGTAVINNFATFFDQNGKTTIPLQDVEYQMALSVNKKKLRYATATSVIMQQHFGIPENILGSLQCDADSCAFIGLMSKIYVQSYEHIMSAVLEPSSWTSMERGLPSLELVQKRVLDIGFPYAFTEEDIQERRLQEIKLAKEMKTSEIQSDLKRAIEALELK